MPTHLPLLDMDDACYEVTLFGFQSHKRINSTQWGLFYRHHTFS